MTHWLQMEIHATIIKTEVSVIVMAEHTYLLEEKKFPFQK